MSVDWEDVYRKVYPDLYRFLMSKVWDAERARDLAQETFVRALSHQPDNPRAWLFSVAANLARDDARTAIRRRGHLELLRGEAEAAEVVEPDAPERLDRDEVQREVERALATLSDRDREVLLLWSSGNSYQDIAEVTDLSPGAIGTTLARARRRLVEAYEGRESDAARNRG